MLCGLIQVWDVVASSAGLLCQLLPLLHPLEHNGELRYPEALGQGLLCPMYLLSQMNLITGQGVVKMESLALSWADCCHMSAAAASVANFPLVPSFCHASPSLECEPSICQQARRPVVDYHDLRLPCHSKSFAQAFVQCCSIIAVAVPAPDATAIGKELCLHLFCGHCCPIVHRPGQICIVLRIWREIPEDHVYYDCREASCALALIIERGFCFSWSTGCCSIVGRTKSLL